MSGAAPGKGPLAGVRVLDLSRLLPGGFCSLLLATGSVAGPPDEAAPGSFLA